MRGQYDSYTNIHTIGDDIVVRLRDAETKRPTYFKIAYRPKTFTPCTLGEQTGKWRTLDDTPLRATVYPTLDKYYAHTRAMRDAGTGLYGVISPVQQFIAEHVTTKCGLPFDSLRIVYLDIEVDSEGYFAPPEDPTQPITAITARVWGHTYVWGFGGSYTAPDESITYHDCHDELHLLRSFLAWWTSDYPDVVTGWNVDGFDIPYIVNRIELLRQQKKLTRGGNSLSPWGRIARRTIESAIGETHVVDLYGISTLDYAELYKKFCPVKRESYRLDFIAELELGEKKVSYDEYGSLQRLARENYQRFIEYNINDVLLVEKLNNKLVYLNLCIQLAYGSRVNFPDTFKQVRLWDSMMYYALADQYIAVPPKTEHDKGQKYTGGYVKVPNTGKHSWIVSYDVNSLYPSIMRQWNISPDRHLPIEWLRRRRNQILPEDVAVLPLAPEDCTPREWLFHIADEDRATVAAALDQLIAYLESDDPNEIVESVLREASMDRALALLDQSDDPWPWLRVLSVCLTPNQQVFRVDGDGFLSIILSKLYEERVAAKKKESAAEKKAAKVKAAGNDPSALLLEASQWKLQQTIRKINLNSCYGAVGNQHFRFFDVRQAEAVTTMGQVIIRYVANRINRMLNAEFGTNVDYVLASDTDSVYVTLDVVVKDRNDPPAALVDVIDAFCEKRLQAVIDDAFAVLGRAFNTPSHILAMKREVIAERGVWKAKKHYILWVHDTEGLRHPEPKMKMVGIEAVKSSTPKFARDVIKQALMHFIRDDYAAFATLLDTAEQTYQTLPFQDIASPRGCNGLNKYALQADGSFVSGTPIQVKGALIYNRHIESTGMANRYPLIRNGEKIRFCYLKKHNPLGCNVISSPAGLPVEWALDEFLDRAEQFDKTILTPIQNIVTLGGWSVYPTSTLDF